MKSLPPYARELLAARRLGTKLNVFVHAGDHSWHRARCRRPPNVLCLPPADDFLHYNWNCCRGLGITLVVWNRPAEFVDGFARHLILAGADLIAALDAEHDGDRIVAAKPTFYRLARAAKRAA